MEEERNELVSMPSRADDSFLLDDAGKIKPIIIHVSMPSRADGSFLLTLKEKLLKKTTLRVNALSG